MKKRLISLLLMLMLACTPAYAMEKAASLPDMDALERYASFEQNGTVWSVRSNQTEAALARISAETAPYNGYACFGVELTGDSETGVTVPVLAFYYAGSVALNGRTASIAAGGARYDIALYSEPVQLGRNSAERMTAPLDEEGLTMIHEILNAEEVTISIQGDAVFTMEPEQKATYATAREELAARSLEGLTDMLNEFEQLGEYDLWDLNEIWWERTRGVEPRMQKVMLPAAEDELAELAVKLEEPMYMLSRGMATNAVRDLQEMLIDAGYMQGKADGAYGEGTVRAVRAAQQYMGLMPTGSADEALIRLLSGDASAMDDPAAVSMEATELYALGGVCEMTIERHWIADAVESAGGDRRTVSDKDDTLVIYEGTVRNLSVEDLDFYWQLSAKVVSGGYEYPCVLVCERNKGASLATSLPPMGEARLLIYAEVPETIAQSEWTLEIAVGEDVQIIE